MQSHYPLVTCSDLTFCAPSTQGKRAAPVPLLNRVTCHFNAQQVTGIIGPNGAGKTTLLRLLYAEYQPSAGTVILNGQNIHHLNHLARAKKIAVVNQLPEQHFALSLRDVVTMGLTPHKSAWQGLSEQDHQAIECWLHTFDLSHKQHQVFSSLSGGEKQRALLARAMLQRPELLILDEPTNHLDVRYQHQLLSLLKPLKLTVVMAIHDLNLAAQYCDSLCLLHKGELVTQGSPEQVLSAQRLSMVFGLPCQVSPHPVTHCPQVHFYAPEAFSQSQAEGSHHAC